MKQSIHRKQPATTTKLTDKVRLRKRLKTISESFQKNMAEEEQCLATKRIDYDPS
tara:strand:+ start:257 stop:421 length:165 start_codon:yes stop_codon:yes gene_type:complete